MLVTERLQIRRIQREGDAASEKAKAPPRSAAGLFLKYDPNLTTFVLIDKNEPNPEDRPKDLGGVAMTSVMLREVYGLSEGQVHEAIGRCIHSFGGEIDLSWVVRLASTEVIGTPEQAQIYIDGIENPFLRVFAHLLHAHITASGPPPVLQPQMTAEDAEDVVRVLASFGLKMPTDPGIERVASLVAELGEGAAAASDPVVADVVEIERIARNLVEMVSSSMKDVRELVPQLPTAALATLASQVRGTRIALSAIFRAVKESVGS